MRAATVDTLPGGTLEVHNPASGAWMSESPGWSLVEDLRIGSVEGDSTAVFGLVGDVEVDEGGLIWVLDLQPAGIQVFDRDGEFVRSVGRRGEGPGEILDPWGIQKVTGGQVWVVDVGNHRYTLFDSLGAVVEERRRFSGGRAAPWPGAVMEDGRVVDVDFDTNGARYTIFSRDGTVLDSVVVPPFESAAYVHATEISRVSAPVPFAPRLRLLFDARGYLWTGISGSYRIVQRDLTGRDSLLVVHGVHDPVTVTDAEREEALAGFDWFRDQGGEVDASRVPAQHPAFNDFIVDDRGFLWVDLVTRPEGEAGEEPPFNWPTVFDVFDPSGRYLGRLPAGMNLRSVLVRGSELYGVTTDELDVQYVVRLRVAGREPG